MAKANAKVTVERVDYLQGMILAGETNTACVAYARQAWGGLTVPGLQADQAGLASDL